MSTYRLDDGKVFDTDLAKEHWDEQRDFDGRNHIGRSTGSQWRDDVLFLTSKDRWVLVHSSRVQGEGSSAEILTDEQAVAWLLHNDYDVPEGMQSVAREVVE
jgi:hypothetical protein